MILRDGQFAVRRDRETDDSGAAARAPQEFAARSPLGSRPPRERWQPRPACIGRVELAALPIQVLQRRSRADWPDRGD